MGRGPAHGGATGMIYVLTHSRARGNAMTRAALAWPDRVNKSHSGRLWFDSMPLSCGHYGRA